MAPKRNIIAMAITLVVSGAMTYKEARKERNRIKSELCSYESGELRQELEVIQECVKIYEAQKFAIKDWRTNV